MATLEHFNRFLHDRGIRRSLRRDEILKTFLKCEQHVTVNELVELVHKRNPKIGVATIYRSLKLFTEAGIGSPIEFGDGTIRYEHDYGHEHHDHLVCVKCGSFREINNASIEKEQERIARQNGFRLLKHKMVLHGLCPKCGKK